jgi:hypothetical protein
MSQEDDDPNPPRPFRHVRDLTLNHRLCHRPFRQVRENRVISIHPHWVGEMRGEQLLAHGGVGKAKVDVVQQEILSAFAGFASRQNIRLEVQEKLTER